MQKNKINKIGILGGTFDPAHCGHIKISKEAKRRFNLDQIFWLITKKNPDKKKALKSLKERINFDKKINLKNLFIKVKYFEKQCKSNRTYKLLKFFYKKYPKTKIYLIMGADNLINFHKWKNWKKIPKICILLIFDRDGFKSKALKSVSYKKINNKRLKFIRFNKVNISSSTLRKI